jgi:Uma2 family endonuclease
LVVSDLAVAQISEDEYVAFELAADQKHEFVDGKVLAMAGDSIRHNRIAGNLAIALRRVAGNGPCEVSIGGVRLRVNSKRHYYPDVMVCCDEPHDSYSQSTPCLIAEVLSPTTSALDRGEKRLAYMAIPSVRHVLVIDHDGLWIDHIWRTGSDDGWRFELGLPGMQLHIICPAVCELSVDEVFA